jgi:heme/copper-type cytochrome/quinol oxidase subunit 3
MNLSTKHPYHIVDPSPWPFLTGFAALGMLTGVVMFSHKYFYGLFVLTIGLLSVIYVAFFWWRDIIREATFEGQHTSHVQVSLRMGMILFIISEWFLFVAFFWGFFHSALAPVPEIGSVWPPVGVQTMSAWGVPLLNTIILVSSGATITVAHHAIVCGERNIAIEGLLATIGLATLFTLLQVFEYNHSIFTMSDGIYGSTFFSLTGLHGFHVIVGTTFLCVNLARVYFHHFSREHHFGFEAGAWYWHFVDVVWLFLFICVYWWGGK